MTARSKPRESAPLRARDDPTSLPPTVIPMSSPPVALASCRPTSAATGSYSLNEALARPQSTVPSGPTLASCGLAAHL